MANEIEGFQHPDFVWTWKESSRGSRQGLWVPYLQGVEKVPRSKSWLIRFSGGEVTVRLADVDTVMLYGASGVLPVEFLDELNQHKISLLLHRRNMPRPYVFSPAAGGDEHDLLGKQIIARQNMMDSTYVARTLIRERLHSFRSVSVVAETAFRRLNLARNIDEVRSIEAQQTARYWEAYYQKLGLSDLSRRDCPHPVNAALDAGSFFLTGVLLRWVLFHKFSPYHGFLHRPTNYTGLVFDLLEPYRGWIERSVSVAWQGEEREEERLTAKSIAVLKEILEEQVYVPMTRQTVRRKSLLHGSVLSLRAWLIGKQARFVVPVEGVKKGGRPVKVGFSIPGYPIPE